MKSQFPLRLLLLAGLLAGTACAQIQFQRSEASGYGDSMTESPSTARDYFQARYKDEWNYARQDLGIPAGQALTDTQKQEIHTRMQLIRLEKGLRYEQERKQYYSLKPYFHNDLERIAFLEQPTREARAQWAHLHGITSNDTKVDPTTSTIIQNNDLARGMTPSEVRESWGEPDTVEYAGDPVYENERWQYTTQVSTENGYKQETRYVYFESGRVAGWETN